MHTADLVEPFRSNVDRFLATLRAAGANVNFDTTYRPSQRAHLMYYSNKIANHGFDPRKFPAQDPPMAGQPQEPPVDGICWAHHDRHSRFDLQASRDAARKMVAAYHFVLDPTHPSRHEVGRAIDMNITWNGTLNIADANGKVMSIQSLPRTGAGNHQLWDVGRTYGVNKLPADHPHWSDDGR
jgi:hypothetical protein